MTISPFATAALPGIEDIARASDAAQDYLRALMVEKATKQGCYTDEVGMEIDSWIARHNSRAAVSANIDRLKAEGFTGHKDTRPSADITAALPDVPAGRYAVATEDGAINELAFYKVDRPTEGRWAGYVFVSRLVGGGEIKLGTGQSAKAALRKIAAVGPEAASAAYGHEIGRCGVCFKTLTNDESRARGIGPVCAAKAGW